MNVKRKISLALAGVMTASVVLTGCGNRIDQDAVVATLKTDDTTIEIQLGLANFIAQVQAVSYSSYMSYFGENMWSSDLYGTGSTMTDDVKSSVMDGILNGKLLERHMSDYDVEITDEELDAIHKTAKQFMEDNTKKAIQIMGAKEEYVVEMLTQNLTQSKMNDAITAEVDTNVTDEEAAQRTYSYIEVDKAGHDDEEGNYVEYTEDEQAQLETDAKAMAEAAKDDFEGAAEQYGYEVETNSYGAGEESLDEAIVKAADALKEGEVSALVTTEGSYYVIRLDSEFDKEKTEQKKESIINKRKSDYYNEILQGYKDKAEWTINEEVWATVNFDEFYSIKASDDTEAAEATE